MDPLKENFDEINIGTSLESLQKALDAQRELFHSQIGQLQNVVVRQCQLTGVNPLAQEMAAGALSVKIGKRPRDLLNPKAIKYMQAVFSIKDAVNKKEFREISARFGVTVTQVRDFFAGQRTKVRKQVRFLSQRAIRSDTCKEPNNGVSDPMIPIQPVPLNIVAPINAEEAASSSTTDDTLSGVEGPDKHFVENIFSMMQKEETFSGQIKLLEWILQIQNPTVLLWFLTKGGVITLATWLSEAAIEEQTTELFVILEVLSHLPLHKALPEHMSVILQSVNRLRLYRSSDISNRARTLLSRWSKIFARSQAAKKPNGLKSSTETQNEMLLKKSINEIMGDESWQSNVENSVSWTENKNKSPQALKLLPAPTDDSSRKLLGVSSSHNRERRKVQLVEQPGQKVAGKGLQATRAVPVSRGRPMSADDIQKAKMRALYMQNKHGKTSSTSNKTNEVKTEALERTSISQANVSSPVSKVQAQPKPEEQKRPVIHPPITSHRLETSLDKQKIDAKEPPWEKCTKVQIPWQTPPEMKLDDLWRVGAGENSKEVDIQKNRNRREKETIYHTVEEIPPNPKEPWDREMDYDDTLTTEIPTEQPPENDGTDPQAAHHEHANGVVTSTASTSQIGGNVAAEPDFELLAVLLKNPELVFALTSGQAGNLTGEETVKLLDMIKAGGADLAANLNGFANKVEEKVEVSLPSPTPSSNPGTDGWRPEAVRNPFSQQSSVGNKAAHPSPGVEKLPSASLLLPHIPAANITMLQQQGNGASLAQQLAAAMTQLLPQVNTMTPDMRQPLAVPSVHQSLPANSPIIQKTVSEVALTMKNQSIHSAYLPNSSAAAAGGPSLRVETMTNIKPAPMSTPPNTQEKLYASLPTLLPTQTRLQTQLQQLQPQASLASDSPQLNHPYTSRPTPGNLGPPATEHWRVRQNLVSNPHHLHPHSQTSRNKYNEPFGGPDQPQLRAGPPWEGNEHVGDEGFESWSPENSPRSRSQEYVPGSSLEPRMNQGWSYRADKPWQQQQQRSPSGYWDQNRQGNRRWNDRRR